MNRFSCVLGSAAVLFFAGLNSGSATARGPSDSSRPDLAVLSGDNEVPPVETDATGLAAFSEIAGGNVLLFALFTFGLEDTVQAHIHLGPPDENGPVVAFLFGAADPPVTQDGLLSSGVLTAADLVGPLEGEPLSALLEEIDAGNTYVNVHTVENPGGEIRGQIGDLLGFVPAQ